MKKFFTEFKKFITRGNVVDMAVGVIVGSSFTAIVNGLSNFILKPLINALLALLLGGDALDKVYTYLIKVTDETGAIDLTKSIYIDWGSFINAVINFFLVAFVLFTIVKIINKIRENGKKFEAEARKGRPSKEDRKEMKKRGIKFSDANAVADFYEEKAAKEAAAKAAAEEKARLEKEANPSTEELLKQIRDLIKEQK
jgi:large conductance mechanosensitive channel